MATITEALNTALQHHQAGRLSEAEAIYRQILQAQPDHPGAHHLLGMIAYQVGKHDIAVEYVKQAIALNPAVAEFHNNLGTVYLDQDQVEAARPHFATALQLQPDYVEAHYNMGNLLRNEGKFEEAVAQYRQALRLKPDYAGAHWNLSLVLLLTGNFTEGWQEHEWRWAADVGRPWKRDFPQPLWDGTDISGRTILLHAEQGFGDALQFVRYVPLVAKRGARVVLECQPELKALFKSAKGVKVLVAKGEPLPEFDVHAPLLSLPRIFGTTLETIPAPVSYLSVNSKLAAAWRDRMGGGSKTFKVGVAWSGNPTQGNNRNRSASLDLFAPLGQVGGVTFYSLQKGGAAQEAASPPKGMTLIDLTAELKDFADTAALLNNLDLVVTVDTAVAHLAGAMGKPVWTLLTFAPDWRWLLKRRDCPWYPTMQLFRQERPGDWAGTVARVAGALQDMVRVVRVSVRS